MTEAEPATSVQHLVLISGCSGGGKSTLLAELAARGHATVEEPGRRIAEDEAEIRAWPWVDMGAFLNRCLELATLDHQLARAATGPVFFDRGLPDALTGLARRGPLAPRAEALITRCRYAPRVFVAPPWPALFAADPARRHGLAEAVAEFEALMDWLPHWGYEVVMIPRMSVSDRADWIEDELLKG